MSASEQAERDAEAEQLVAGEFDQEMPSENRAALESEFRQRFGRSAPTWKFTPLDDAAGASEYRFTPLEPEEPSAMPSGKTLALNNPLTAIGETALNLGTQAVALPAAGLAGLITEAGRTLGLTERSGADVVHAIGEKLTYQPRGEMGKQLTGLVMIPFEKLAEAGQWAGGKALDATGSPGAATAVDTAIQAIPMMISPALRAGKAGAAKVRERFTPREEPVAQAGEYRFIPLEEAADAAPAVNPARGAAEAGRGIPEPTRAIETPAAADLASPERLPASVTPDIGATPLPKTARWALVEADDLKPSHDIDLRPTPDYPENLARPDWARTDAESRVQDINRRFDPNRLAKALDDADGAPVVARDGIVEAGNARAVAIQRVYQADGLKADSYRQFLRVNAADFGLTPDQIDVMKKPALVRVPDEPAPRHGGGADFSATIEATAAEIAEFRQRGLMLDPRALEAADLAPEAKAAIAFLRENAHNPERIREFSARVNEAMDNPEATEGATVQNMAAGTRNSWAPGSLHTGFIEDGHLPATAPTTSSRAKPITREEVLAPFLKALDVRLYEGRVKGEKKLGHYRKTIEEVRIKRKSDLEVAAHEIGHLLDDRVPAISSAWRSDKALREELKSISYDTGKVAEGYAEGVRLFLTQPDVLQAKAPKVYAWLDDFANTHEHGSALRKAQEGMTGWFGQEAIDRARSKIGACQPINEALDGIWDKFRQATVDDLHGVYRMERNLQAGKIAPMGAYETTRLARASHSIADGAMRYGAPVRKPEGSFTFKGKGLEEILKPVAKKLDDALLYFVGRSANELMGQGREHLFSRGEIDAMLRLRTPEREAAFQEYQAWNKSVLDFAEAHGVINPAARSLWQRQAYVPFWRVEQPGSFKGGKPGDWSGIKALTGGTDNLRDILKNMTGNAAMLIDKAVKNEARLKIAELAEQPGGGKFMVKIGTETRLVKIDGQQVMDVILKTLGIDQKGSVSPQMRKTIARLEEQIRSGAFDFMLANQPPAGRNVVAVLRGGKPEWYEVADPILYRALTAIDRPAQHWIVKLLGLPKRVGQTTITATADFWMANIARDTLMGSVMSRAGFRPILDSLDGMRMRIAKDPLYKEWIANGGGLSSIYLDEARFKAKLEKFYGRQGIDYRTVLDTPDKLMGFIETLGDAFESSTRLGEFKRALARGENPRHAAYLAREVSTDFAMKGDSKALGFMYDTVMFLRPAVVSMDRLARGIAHDPNKGAIAAKAGAIALASVGLYLLNRDDPRYADLPDWDRDANWHFFVGDQHFRYPKIWEIGAMASAAERSVEKLMAEDPLGLAKDFARIIANTFSLNLMPQIVAPLKEQATNRNSFTGAPIETPGMENVQPFLRAKPGTSETMKAAGMATRDLPESLQVNPARAEALLRGYFNTWALYGLMLTDQAFYGDKLPEKRADEMPVVRRFYANEPAKHTKYESQFYDLLGEAKRLRGTLKELDEMNLRGLADDKEKSPMTGEAKPLERAAKNLGAINNEMQDVRRDANLTPAEKRQKLDALTVERNALLKEAVIESKKAQKEKTP